MITAYWNFRIVSRRKDIISKVHVMRKELFDAGIGMQIVLADYNSEFGIDEKSAIESSAHLRDLTRIGLSEDSMRTIIPLAITLLGPIGFPGVLADYRSLSKIALAYRQLQKRVSGLTHRSHATGPFTS